MRLSPLVSRLCLGAALAAALALAACSGTEFGAYNPGSPVAPSWDPAGSGARLEIRLKDGPIDEVDAVVVTIEGIELHRTGGPFFEVMEGPETFDLLELKDETVTLADLDIEPGRYTQIRLLVSSGEVTVDGETHPLEIPSGVVKIIRPFTIPEGALAVMIIDFDAAESLHIVETGNARYILRPVIKIEGLEFYTEEDCPEASSTDPADGATDVPVDASVTVTFPDGTEMPADPAGLITLKDAAGNDVPGTTTVTGTVATFVPDAALAAGMMHKATVVRSLLPGYEFCTGSDFTFTTAP